MSLRDLPVINAFERPDGYSWDAPSEALDRWSTAPHAAAPQAAEADGTPTISIYDVIGEDYWSGGGFTAKRLAAALRAIGPVDLTVNINSPGGDVFEGVTIYNLLREHPARVSVKVMGIAASAASFIAMAGDHIAMGLGSFLMIHNAWSVVVGNRNDMRAAADLFEKFDGAMADIYAARTGLTLKVLSDYMDEDTYFSAGEAVAKGFADAIMTEAAPSGGGARAEVSARRRLDALLAKQGVPRSERRRLVREANGTPGAAVPQAKPGAGLDMAAVARLISTIKP